MFPLPFESRNMQHDAGNGNHKKYTEAIRKGREGKEEGRKEGRKEGGREGGREGRKEVPRTWYHVLGTTYLVPGTWYQVLGTWYQVLGTRYWVPGTGYQRVLCHSMVANLRV